MALRAEYLKQLTANRGLTNSELARRIGVSREQIGRWLNGTSTDMSLSNALAISRELGLPVDALFDEATSLPSNVSILGEDAASYPVARTIPVVGLVGAADSALNLSFGDGEYPPGFGPYGVVEIPLRDPGAFALRVEGDSMEPGVPSGSTVVAAERPLVDGSLSVVQALDGRAWLKRVRRVNGSYLLESFNTALYPPFILRVEDVRQIWRVIWIRFPV